MTMSTGFGVCLRYLNTLGLVEDMNRKVAVPSQDDIRRILGVGKLSAVFAPHSPIAAQWSADSTMSGGIRETSLPLLTLGLIASV
ncbi:Uu.00g059810.m01.CDS01 [Anthostomella pinea]|uniref:Uu.00g059810.m01.CDS01 n=1 Tax=Anthostomella pinea TaxID=933095 RepID=A0AAI8YJZ9_9PEZI|nr:Uu.00g059810.m01.CDS01 [Anthostomella pinea]